MKPKAYFKIVFLNSFLFQSTHTKDVNFDSKQNKFHTLKDKNTKMEEFSNMKMKTSAERMSVEFMLNYMNDNEDHKNTEDNQGHLLTDTVRCFSSNNRRLRGPNNAYKFNINFLSGNETINKIDLQLRSSYLLKNQTRLKYIIRRNNKVMCRHHSTESLKWDGKYASFHVSDFIMSMLNDLHDDVTVQISFHQMKSDNNSSLRFLEFKNEQDALLTVFSQNQAFDQKMFEHIDVRIPLRLSRTKRTVLTNFSKRSRRRKSLCHLQKFNVDFKQLGWSKWVIHPKIYNAGICSGICRHPMGDELEPTNHAILQNLMRIGKSKKLPMPCCAPTKLKPMKLLYLEKNELVARHHDNMIVSSCGCR